MSEVFPTELMAIGADELWVGVRWPRRHMFYADPYQRVDSYLLIETIRQITILTCHQHFNTPLDAHFVMPGIGARLDNSYSGFGLPPFGVGGSIAVHIDVVNVRFKNGGGLQSVQLETQFYSDGQRFATGHGDAMVVNERVYSRLRQGRTHLILGGCSRSSRSVVSPRRVGHQSFSDVVLSQVHTDESFVLSLDLGNPTLFDHPLDHVAGMIPVEACRQIMRLQAGPRAEFEQIELVFSKALEFDGTITAKVEHSGRQSAVTFMQNDEAAVVGVFTPRPWLFPSEVPG